VTELFEGDLLRAWVQGDRTAGDRLLARLLPGIYGLCLRMLRRPADAEDAAQETFARLCASVRRGEQVRDTRRWAATVAMNLCIDLKRKHAQQPLVEWTEGDSVTEPADTVDPGRLKELIERLPERYRLALHHRFVLGLKPRDIAAAMGLEDVAARVLLHRALSALRRLSRS
jgi:RNA polymerase sigma-70 factor (ECF subfamily)